MFYHSYYNHRCLKSPALYIVNLHKKTICVSGTETSESFSIPNFHKPFRNIFLSKTDVTDIISVIDLEGNEYFEVESLVQDTVYKSVKNLSDDRDIVSYNIEPIPATRRYTSEMNFLTGITTITFGGGDAESFDDDIIPPIIRHILTRIVYITIYLFPVLGF